MLLLLGRIAVLHADYCYRRHDVAWSVCLCVFVFAPTTNHRITEL